MNQPELLQLARVAANEAKKLAGGILASGCGNTQTEHLAEAIAQLCHCVDALAEHLDPLTMQQRAALDLIATEPLCIAHIPAGLGKALIYLAHRSLSHFGILLN